MLPPENLLTSLFMSPSKYIENKNTGGTVHYGTVHKYGTVHTVLFTRICKKSGNKPLNKNYKIIAKRNEILNVTASLHVQN
jgi:hypothetical protein